MQRLIEAGLTVLLVSNVVVPVNAAPQASKTIEPQPTAETIVKDGKAQAIKPTVEPQAETRTLSDRDRLVLERRFQRLIPPQQ